MSHPIDPCFDLGAVAPAERAAAVLRRLDAVPPGTPLQFASDARPDAILAALQAQWPSDFDWVVLGEGPPAWRVEVTRRAGEHLHGVQEYLGEEHQRFDRQLDTVVRRTRTARPDYEFAAQLFVELRTGIERHIRTEEEVLFPVFETRTGLVGGPVQVMTDEHREIEVLLQRTAARLAAEQPIDDIVLQLRSLLVAHHQREEQALYVMTDRHLDATERAELIRKMQQM